MKKSLLLTIITLLALVSLHAQTNTFPASGNVGIGTVSPSAKLVIDAGSTNGLQIITANDGPWGLILKNASYAGGGFGIYQNNAGTIGLYANYPNGSAISINPTGGIGIDPAGGLVYVGGGVVFGTSSGTNITIRSYSDGRNWGIRDDVGVNRLRFARGSTDQVFWDVLKADSSDAIAGQIWYSSGAERMRIDSSGNVGIGTNYPTQKLSVNGTIRAKEIIVDTGWADYVFAPDYKLASLSEVETHIKVNGHLPGIPSAKEVAEHGVSMGEMQAKLLAKIEELTLHQIEQEKHQHEQDQRIQNLETENRTLRGYVDSSRSH